MVITNDKLCDKGKSIKYTVGELLGRGGFATCFILKDEKNRKFAGKVIPKTDFKKNTTKEKLQQEITIHSKLNHENIVGFINYFDDEKNVYIVLEMCACKSMHELLKRRKKLLLPETRYFTQQIALACQYLHENLIIHRDLKLANVFLDKDLRVKVGDFGLATQLDSETEKKKTMCGTPNYIAPEILSRGGHSFEVDVWALGVIIYTLIFGRPPFETENLQSTYNRIKSIKFGLPSNIEDNVRGIINSILIRDVKSRPSMKNLLEMEFFKKPIPTCLPTSILSCPPQFENMGEAKPDINHLLGGIDINERKIILNAHNNNLLSLEAQITKALKAPLITDEAFSDSEDPKLAPIFWITKWVDYSDRYGVGYQLNDRSTGVFYNDETLLLYTPNCVKIHYIDKDGMEKYYEKGKQPKSLAKKIMLLEYFHNYMKQNLASAGGEEFNPEKENMVRLPFLAKYVRNDGAMVLYMSSGVLQVNFMEDHVKLVICPLMSSVTIIHPEKPQKTYNLTYIQEHGITKDLFSKFDFVLKTLNRLMK